MRVGLTCGLFSLVACATLPDVKVTYFPAVAHTKITVTQALDCSQDKTRLISVTSVAPVTTFSSDRTAKPHTLLIRDLDGSLSDTHLDFSFTEDGRLKSINAETTGEAEAIVTSAITLATAIAGPLGGGRPPKKPPTACQVIANWGKDKLLTLSYSTDLQSN